MADASRHYLDATLHLLRSQKRLAERAFAQLEPEDYHRLVDPEANSVAVLIKHLAGNMRSRFRDFLTSDGEKPDRNRDAEFVDDVRSPDALLHLWEEGWGVVFSAVEVLGPDDLLRIVTIRGEPHTVVEALQRQASHCAYHVGQIVLLARYFRGEAWTSLSIPRGESRAFLAAKRPEFAGEAG